MIDERMKKFMLHLCREANAIMGIITPICEKAEAEQGLPEEEMLKIEYARGRMECLRDMARKLGELYGPDAELKRLAEQN